MKLIFLKSLLLSILFHLIFLNLFYLKITIKASELFPEFNFLGSILKKQNVINASEKNKTIANIALSDLNFSDRDMKINPIFEKLVNKPNSRHPASNINSKQFAKSVFDVSLPSTKETPKYNIDTSDLGITFEPTVHRPLKLYEN